MSEKNQIEIRQAVLSDLDQLAPLFDEYRSFYGRAPEPKLASEFLKDRIAARESTIFIAKRADSLIGFAQLYPTFSSLSMKPSWILNDLFVSPNARGLGLGRALLVHSEKFAAENGAISVTLKTSKSNSQAQRLYESNGWKKDTDFYTFDLKIGK